MSASLVVDIWHNSVRYKDTSAVHSSKRLSEMIAQVDANYLWRQWTQRPNLSKLLIFEIDNSSNQIMEN